MNIYQRSLVLLESCDNPVASTNKEDFVWRKREFTRKEGLDSIGASVTLRGSSVTGKLDMGNGNSLWFDSYGKDSHADELNRIDKIIELLTLLKKNFKKASSKIK